MIDLQLLLDEKIAAYLLYRAADKFMNEFVRNSDLWISAQLHTVKMENQYNIAQRHYNAELQRRLKLFEIIRVNQRRG